LIKLANRRRHRSATNLSTHDADERTVSWIEAVGRSNCALGGRMRSIHTVRKPQW
jgi:hypothetical protein